MSFPARLPPAFLRIHSKNPAPDERVFGTEQLQRALWMTLRRRPCLRGLNVGWGAVGTGGHCQSVNHLPNCPSADSRVSSTLADPDGVLLPILTPAFTDLATNQILAGCFQPSPCPSNSHPICGSASPRCLSKLWPCPAGSRDSSQSHPLAGFCFHPFFPVCPSYLSQSQPGEPSPVLTATQTCPL